MTMLFMFLISLIIAIAIFTVTAVFGYNKNRILKVLFRTALCVSIFCGCFCLVLSGIYDNRVIELNAVHADLTLYQPLVEETTNEYVRYDFYDKVNDFNERYEEMEKISENNWVGGLVRKDWSATMGPIDFYLHGAGE